MPQKSTAKMSIGLAITKNVFYKKVRIKKANVNTNITVMLPKDYTNNLKNPWIYKCETGANELLWEVNTLHSHLRSCIDYSTFYFILRHIPSITWPKFPQGIGSISNTASNVGQLLLKKLLDHQVEQWLFGAVAEWLLVTELTCDIVNTYKCKGRTTVIK